MRVSQTPRLKATNKSPILETLDAPKRSASQYGFAENNYDNDAFYINPGFGELDLLAPGYDQLDD